MEIVMSSDSIREERLSYLMEQHGDSLLRMCCVYLRDTALAEDAVQETFVKAYKSIDAFHGDCSEKTWLMRIAINTCKDFRRTSWYRYVDRSINLDRIPSSSCLQTAEQSSLAIAVMLLPKRLMEVVLLYYYQELTTREIALALSIPQQTVSSRLIQARGKLRIGLEGGLYNE